MGNIQIKNI